ncbi:MAG: guanylate kinase [Rhodospirillaceae bacterium]|jgi:guanylate kinase|nr:guanylate kinase [Rhodospirillaceae bacterium]MBT5244218.1 guanylate kinase [Rhodospirillaceae bacterium]MBT5561743.1 guanylate kinase [Rhodospirillaceae bacterium]MBT6243182.1 guanylate kinase [Rhodospirillaceae bacterium]MBT7137425.1 guanylate kinase [Rhodospirillaceae bacterium]
MNTDPTLNRRGLMIVLSSPSGAGKSTISRALMERDDNLTMSVSATTRAPRPGEVDGKDYYFVDKATFDAMVGEGNMLEHAQVFDNFYGTPKDPVEAALKEGRDVMFDVDWQGTQQLAENASKDLVRVFILPPSMEELERRLYTRAQDSEEVVKKRMAEAAAEMSHYPEYDYIVVNTDIDDSVSRVVSILNAERQRTARLIGLHDFVSDISGE